MFVMKAMKTCKMGCGGKMKSGGAVSKIKKMKTGGQNIVGMPGYNATIRPMQMKAGGATKFGMLSVKAGIDNNPKATAADRIAGAKKNSRKKKK